MTFGTGLFTLGFGAVIVAAFFPRARVRAAAQAFSGTIAVLSAVLTAALVVGGVVLESRGGGVLLLAAVVPGLVAWVAWTLFSMSRRYSALRQRPVEVQRRETIADFEATLDTGLARLARLRAQRDRLLTSASRRAALDRAIAHEERMLGLLPMLRPALEDVRAYEQERPASPADHR